MDLRAIRSQEQAVELLSGWSEITRAELEERRIRRPLVKSYMLESAAAGSSDRLRRLFTRSGVTLERTDGSFMKVRRSGADDYIGFLEPVGARHAVIYTTEPAKDSDRFIKTLVSSSPALDRLWISGAMFSRLWDRVQKAAPRHRFGKLVFQYENPFDVAPPSGTGSLQDVEFGPSPESDEDAAVPERRGTRFAVVEKISVLQEILPQMQVIYSPLYSIAQLRLPGSTGGGHDFYYDGKATNRTDSFVEHRQQVRYVLEVYRRATEATEQAAWTGASNVENVEEVTWRLGAPVHLQFKAPLELRVLHRFVDAVFVRHHAAFGLWGNPIWLSPSKVHVYALDRHVARQLYIEITDRDLVAVIPSGTCGNSIHRLVTNIQQLLDPGVKVTIGGKPYSSLIEADPEQMVS